MEEALDLSSDRILNELMNEYIYIYIYIYSDLCGFRHKSTDSITHVDNCTNYPQGIIHTKYLECCIFKVVRFESFLNF